MKRSLIIIFAASTFVVVTLGARAANTCEDTDAGQPNDTGLQNWFVRGTMTSTRRDGSTFTSTDFCIQDKAEDFDMEADPDHTLMEYGCYRGYGSASEYDCPYGCKEGECIPEPESCEDPNLPCGDSSVSCGDPRIQGANRAFVCTTIPNCTYDAKLADEGKAKTCVFGKLPCEDINDLSNDPEVAGMVYGYDQDIYFAKARIAAKDTCDNDLLRQVACGPNGYIQYIQTKCALGCRNGACLNEDNVLDDLEVDKCTDTDGGKRYYQKGSASGEDLADDECLSNTTLQEAYCERHAAVVSTTEFQCPNGCSKGRCNRIQAAVLKAESVEFFDEAVAHLSSEIPENLIVRYRVLADARSREIQTGVTSAVGKQARIRGLREIFDREGGAGTYIIEFAICPIPQHVTLQIIDKDICGSNTQLTVRYDAKEIPLESVCAKLQGLENREACIQEGCTYDEWSEKNGVDTCFPWPLSCREEGENAYGYELTDAAKSVRKEFLTSCDDGIRTSYSCGPNSFVRKEAGSCKNKSESNSYVASRLQSMKARVCERVSRRFSRDSSIWARIQSRLTKRFGFFCS